MSSQFIPRLQIAIGAVLFSTGGVAIKATVATGWSVSGIRAAIACAVLLLCLPGARRSLWALRVWLVAIPYAATVTMFVLASKYTTAANAIFLQDTAPFYLLLLAPWLLKESIVRRDIVYMAALVIGLILLLGGAPGASPTATNPGLGNALGVCAGVTWALTIAGMRWLARDTQHPDRGIAAVAAGNLLAFVVALPWIDLQTQLGIQDWLLLIYLGSIQIGLAYFFVTRGIRNVGAFNASLLLLIEPVLNPVWAWLLLRESPGVWPVVGGTLIIAATILHTYLSREVDGVKRKE